MRHDTHLRIARPTDHLEQLTVMYRDGLGLKVLGSFSDHDGFDGVMLGSVDLPYHLEFTREQGQVAGRAPTQENLLVFYIEDQVEWEHACVRMLAAGFVEAVSRNPYWDALGKTFEDPDGYRVVLQNGVWIAE